MQSEVLKIIEGGLTNDLESVIDYSKRLAKKLEEEGDINYSKAVYEILSNNDSKATLDWVNSNAIEKKHKSEFVKIVSPVNIFDSLVLEPIVEIKVNNFINRVAHQEAFKEISRGLKNSLLIYGPAGCGKTTIAKYIAYKSNLPLIIPELDFLIPSFLDKGLNTLKNLKELVETQKGILFFDEFDAIAKSRDNQIENIDLNRLINRTLLYIDDLTEKTVIIAATDRKDLLDDAVWGRFDTTIEINKPDSQTIKNLIETFLKEFNSELIEDTKKIETLVNLFSDKTPAEIANTIQTAIALSFVSNNNKRLDYFYILQEAFRSQRKGENKFIEFVNFLNENGIPQKIISDKLNISMRQVRNHLNKSEL